MWHASVSYPDARTRAQLARKSLKGVGSEKLGEWGNQGDVYHLRRRLTKPEEEIVGAVKDLRGTKEGDERFERFLVKMKLHPGFRQLAELALMEIRSAQCPIVLT